MELTHEVIGEKIEETRYDQATLLKEINKKDPSVITGETRAIIKRRLKEHPSDYLDYTEQDMNSRISNSDIIDIYRKRLIDLQRSHDQLRNRVLSLYKKEAFVSTSRIWADNKNKLDEWIVSLNEYDIIHLLKSPARLEKGIHMIFDDRLDGLDRETLPWEDYLTRLGMTPNDLSIKAQNAWSKMTTRWAYVEAQDVRIFLDTIDDVSASIHTKREIMRDILSMNFPDGIDMREAIKLWLIDHDEALRRTKIQLASWMQDPAYFDIADLEEKRERNQWAERTCLETNMTSYGLGDILLDDTKIDKLLSKEIRKKSGWMERKMANNIEEMKSEYNTSDFALSDMSYADFLGKISSIQSIQGEPKMNNLSSFWKWSILHLIIDTGDGREDNIYLKIDENDITIPVNKIGVNGEKENHHGVRFLDMSRDGGVSPVWAWTKREHTYRELSEYIGRKSLVSWDVLSSEEFSRRTSDEAGSEKIETIYDEGEDAIDSIDKLISLVWFQPERWMMLVFQIESNTDERIIIESIDEASGMIRLNDGWQSVDISFQKFIEFVKKFQVKNANKLENLSDFQSFMKGMAGFEDMVIEWWSLYKVSKEGGKETKTKVTYLKNSSNEILEIESIDDTGITYKYGKIIPEADDSTKSAKQNPSIKPLKSSTQKAWFLELLRFIDKEGEWFQSYIVTSKKEATVDDNIPHFHSYPLAKFLSGTSANDMMKAFEIYTHAWEHKLEKNSKFNSAKFADRYFSRLMPESFRGQLKSEMYSVQNEAMDAILKMLEDTMSGKEARLYVRKKILLNSNARFEEILAGMLYIGKKTGQLYPEELSDLWNSKAWFHQLARSMGYNTVQKRQALWDRAAKKSPKWEFATEADVIERVLKLWEGEQMRIPPNIAPRFAGTIAEGITWQEEKWEKEIEMLSSIDQMNDYALSKLNVGEWYKALKTIKRIYGKNGDAVSLNAIPFTMLMSNVPEYLGTDFASKLHKEATGGEARSTHAFAFGNTIHHVQTYRNMVWEAAEELARRGNTAALAELASIEKKRKEIGFEDHHNGKETEKNQKEFINSLFKFWKKHGSSLHPILQMTDPYIDTHQQESELCRKYKSRIGMITGMQRGRTNTKEMQQFEEGNWVYNHTPPMDYKNRIAAAMKDISTSQGHDMDQMMYEKWFVPSVLWTFNALRSLRVDQFPEFRNLSETAKKEKLREKQKYLFRDYMISTFYFVRTKINSKVWYERSKWKNYMQDFIEHGLLFKESDFINRRTKPQNVHMSEDGTSGMNEEELDPYDEKRIDELFETFLSASPSIKRGVRAQRRTQSAFDRAMNPSRLDASDYMEA